MTSKCKNSSGNSSRRRVVSLQVFEHFDTISMLNKSIDHRKFLSTCFCDNVNSFLITFLLRASQKIKKEKKKSCPHNNINLVCTLSNHSLQVMSAPERNCTFVVKTAFERNGLWKWFSLHCFLLHEAARSISIDPWTGCKSMAMLSPALNLAILLGEVRHYESKVCCQEHNTCNDPARSQSQSSWFGVPHTNH